MLSKLSIVYLAIFVFGGLARFFVGLDSASGDLAYYLAESGVQMTVLGIPKSLVFSPLLLLESYDYRLLAISFILSFLNTMAVIAIGSLVEKRRPLELFFSFVVAIFFIQIDMHLVRQQIGLYLFIIFLHRSGWTKYLLLVGSIVYHEVYLFFLAARFCTLGIRHWFRISSRLDLQLAFVLVLVTFGLFHDSTLLLLGILLLVAFFLYRFDAEPKLYLSLLLIFGLAGTVLGIISDVNLDRYFGVVVSYSMFYIAFSGQFGMMQTRLKIAIKFFILFLYSAYYVAIN